MLIIRYQRKIYRAVIEYFNSYNLRKKIELTVKAMLPYRLAVKIQRLNAAAAAVIYAKMRVGRRNAGRLNKLPKLTKRRGFAAFEIVSDYS